VDGHTAVAVGVHPRDPFSESEGDPLVAHLIVQRVLDLIVHKIQWALPLVDQRDARAEDLKDRGIFHPDDPGANEDHRAGNLREIEQPVGVDDVPVIELDARRPSRPRSDRDDDLVGGQGPRALIGRHQNVMRIDKRTGPRHDLDVIPDQLIPDDVDFGLDDAVRTEGQVFDRNPFFDAIG